MTATQTVKCIQMVQMQYVCLQVFLRSLSVAKYSLSYLFAKFWSGDCAHTEMIVVRQQLLVFACVRLFARYLTS